MAALLVAAGAAPASAGEVTEELVIRAVRAADPAVNAARRAAELAEAREVAAGLYPNPALGFERETLAGEAEHTLALTVPVDLSSRRSARRALARVETTERQAGAVRVERDAVARALLLFYEAIAAERELAIAREAAAGLAEAARVLAHRRGVGQASGYEQLRLEIEAELAESERAEAEAQAGRTRRELARVLGIAHRELSLVGDLEPGSRAARPAAPRSLALLGRAAAEAGAAEGSAGRAWIPTLFLSGGLRFGDLAGGDPGDRQRGYLLGLALDLPIFSRGQELRSEARALRARAAAEVTSARRDQGIAARRAADELAVARAELARLQAQTGARVERLQRAAASAYREGELSLVELIDAGRARANVARRLLALARAARRADIALRAARGELE